MILDPIKAAIAPYALTIKAGVALALLVAAFVGGCQVNAGKLADEREAHRATKQANATLLADLAGKTKAAADKAKQASKLVMASRKTADKRYEDATNEAKRNAASLAAALRAGKQRLSATWACHSTRPAAGGVAPDAEQADTERQYDSAARIVAAADADAAAMNWLWDRWLADRKAVIDAGCAVEGAP